MQLTSSNQTPIADGSRRPEQTGNRFADLWQRGQHGWPASYPVVKFPNGPLIVALLAMVGSVVTSSNANNILSAISRIALTVWAYQELTDGGNAIRRILGLGFLVYLVTVLANVNN